MKIPKNCWPVLAVSALALGPSAAFSQTPPAPATAVTAVDFTQIPASQIAAKLTKASGMTVLTDASIAGLPVTFSSVGGSLDMVLKQLWAKLPTGSVVRAALVPETAVTGQEIDGDRISAFLKAQDALIPATRSMTHPDPATAVFDLMGQGVTLDAAAATIANLHLKPVYLLTVPKPSTDPVAKLSAMSAESMRQWQNMTPDQRKASAEQQFHNMMNMEPGERQAMLGQMMEQAGYMIKMIQGMSPEEQQSFQQEAMKAMKGSGILPPAPPK